jgi:hypothetical protein
MMIGLGKPGGGPDYEPATVLPLIEALHEGELAVEVVNVNTHQVEVLPRWFWLGGYELVLIGDAIEARGPAILQSRLSGQPHGPAYRALRVILPPEGVDPTLGNKALIWKIAERILTSPEAPSAGWGQVTRLARMVKAGLPKGRDMELDTVRRHLHDNLKEWQKQRRKR